MAKVKAKYQAIGKELTEAGLVRVACYDVADYWRKKFRRINGIDCGRCGQEQRQKCKDNDLYRECPKAIKIESLDRLIEDADGNQIELSQMIADDNATDVSDRLEARLILQSYPHKFIRIAYKKYAGYPLTISERTYLYRQRSKALKSSQKKTVSVTFWQFSAIYTVRGLKTSCGDLNNASELQAIDKRFERTGQSGK